VKERAGAAASSLGGSGDGDELGVVTGPEGRMAPEEKEEVERRLSRRTGGPTATWCVAGRVAHDLSRNRAVHFISRLKWKNLIVISRTCHSCKISLLFSRVEYSLPMSYVLVS
jgi:hypothetical protein